MIGSIVKSDMAINFIRQCLDQRAFPWVNEADFNEMNHLNLKWSYNFIRFNFFSPVIHYGDI